MLWMDKIAGSSPACPVGVRHPSRCRYRYQRYWNSVSTKPDLSNTLYRERFERDNCGFGLIAHMDGEASHGLVTTAIQSLARMTHRGATRRRRQDR